MENQLKSNQNARLSGGNIRLVMLQGFLIRAALLVLILMLKDDFAPYYIRDDIAYEQTVNRYLANASGVLDLQYLRKLLKGYLQPFWPAVICIFGGVFRTIYVGRVINILISTACIRVIYNTVRLLADQERTALLAAKLFAFLPLPVMVCCFPIKDIYLTWSVLYAFYIFLLVYRRERLRYGQLVTVILGLIGTYFARGAVTELMVIFFVLLWLDSLRQQRRHKTILLVLGLSMVALFLYGGDVLAAFAMKIEDYGGYNAASTGMLSMLQMKNPWEFYKLPFAYFFATLQPMTLDYFAAGEDLWARLMRVTNISMYPVAIANLLYVFQKKHNRLYWLCGAAIYCAVISMCLGIARHYLFLLPLQIINCALLFDRRRRDSKRIVAYGTIAMIIFMTFYSLKSIL